MYSRLLEGPFPNYEQVIPKANPKAVAVARGDLLEAVDRVAAHSDNITHQVRFAVAPGEVELSVNTADVGSGEETIEAEYDGDDLDIGYNATYLLDILNSVETEASVRLDTAITAGIIEPEGGMSESEDLLCLIMPLRLPETVSD